MSAARAIRLRGSSGSRAGGYWKYAVPIAIVISLLYFLPLLINSFLAFTDWSGFKSAINFTGLENFQTLVEQYNLPDQVRLTLVYAVTASFVGNVMALSFALALERPTVTNQVFRAIFFISVLLSPLAAGYVWAGILDPPARSTRPSASSRPGSTSPGSEAPRSPSSSSR